MKYQEISPERVALFNDLMKICDERESFYFQDFPANDEEGSVFRIFNYRQASYTDFCEPGALECRGIMFEVSMYGNPIRLASLPSPKFFNINENPLSMVHDIFDEDPLVHLEESNDKADGSYINSYINYDDLLALKSKGSTRSDQAIASMSWLEERNFFYDEVMMLTQNGWTVNMEWCAPDNRIVLAYPVGHLQVLNVRNNETGEYMSRRDIGVSAPEIKKHMVQLKMPPKADTFDEMMELVRQETGIEGYIFKFSNGLWGKAKTDWYKALHWNKDSINTPRRLFEACVDDATDDLKDMFHDDELALKMIADMEDFVRPIYNGICQEVEDFYNENKDLGQKDYAIAGQRVLGKELNKFGLAMSLYNGKDINYKQNLKKYWKALGLKDEKV